MVRQELSFSRGSRLVKKSPVFYGWIILAAGTLGLILTSPGQTYAVSIFIEHFITDLDLSRPETADDSSAAVEPVESFCGPACQEKRVMPRIHVHGLNFGPSR